ncbi:MAG: TlpA disulfide reductase family protein [Thermoanaerobaculaceae bacterium]|nr:TlpA disulfide reductase family protein [Thermoanaerobaculaceae bacterium]
MRKRSILAAIGGVLVAAAATAQAPRPEFPAVLLTDLAGQAVPLKDLLGTATVLNFWATWCGPCRMEMPELQKLSNEFGGKGFVVLAVNVDLPPRLEEEGVAGQLAAIKPRVELFLKQSGITLPVFLVDGKTQMALGINQIPFSVLLDREGKVVRVYPGYSAESVQDMRRQLLGLLAERSGKGGK